MAAFASSCCCLEIISDAWDNSSGSRASCLALEFVVIRSSLFGNRRSKYRTTCAAGSRVDLDAVGSLQTFVRLRDQKGKGALVKLDAVSEAVQIVNIPCPEGVPAQFALKFDLVGVTAKQQAPQRHRQSASLDTSDVYKTTHSTRITDLRGSAHHVEPASDPGANIRDRLLHPSPSAAHPSQVYRSSSARAQTSQPLQQTTSAQPQSQPTPPRTWLSLLSGHRRQRSSSSVLPHHDDGLKRSSQPLSLAPPPLQQHSGASKASGSSGVWNNRCSLSSSVPTDGASMSSDIYGNSSLGVHDAAVQSSDPHLPPPATKSQDPYARCSSHPVDVPLSCHTSAEPDHAFFQQADAAAIILSFEDSTSPVASDVTGTSPVSTSSLATAVSATLPPQPPSTKKPTSGGGLFARLFVTSRRKVASFDDTLAVCPAGDSQRCPDDMQHSLYAGSIPSKEGSKHKRTKSSQAAAPAVRILATAASGTGMLALGGEDVALPSSELKVVDPLELELQQVLAFTRDKSGLDEVAFAEVASQVQYLLECLKSEERWVVPDCILQLKAEVNFPFDKGQPINDLHEPSATTPTCMPQLLIHEQSAPPLAPAPPSSSGWFQLEVQQADHNESLRVCYAGVDQRGIGGPHACSAIALEVCEWFLRAEEWSNRGLSQYGDASTFSSDSSLQLLQPLGKRRGSASQSHTPKQQRSQIPISSSGSRRPQAGTTSSLALPIHAISCMTGEALGKCVSRGTTLWKLLLNDPEAVQQASTSGDFELEEMLRVGGYSSRLRQAEYCAVSLAELCPPSVDCASQSLPPTSPSATEHPLRQLSGVSSVHSVHSTTTPHSESQDPGTNPLSPHALRHAHTLNANFEHSSPLSNTGMTPTTPDRHSLTFKQVSSSLATPPSFLRGSSSASLVSHFGKCSLGGAEALRHHHPLRLSQRGLLPCSLSLARHSNASSSGCSVQHLQRMRKLTADSANLPRFATFMQALGPGCYVLGCHGHFSSLIVHGSGDVLLIDSLGASLAVGCPHAFILHHASMAEFVAFFRARHQHKCDGHVGHGNDGVSGAGEGELAGEEGGRNSGGDILSGNSAALVEVHHMQLSLH